MSSLCPIIRKLQYILVIKLSKCVLFAWLQCVCSVFGLLGCLVALCVSTLCVLVALLLLDKHDVRCVLFAWLVCTLCVAVCVSVLF